MMVIMVLARNLSSNLMFGRRNESGGLFRVAVRRGGTRLCERHTAGGAEPMLWPIGGATNSTLILRSRAGFFRVHRFFRIHLQREALNGLKCGRDRLLPRLGTAHAMVHSGKELVHFGVAAEITLSVTVWLGWRFLIGIHNTDRLRPFYASPAGKLNLGFRLGGHAVAHCGAIPPAANHGENGAILSGPGAFQD